MLDPKQFHILYSAIIPLSHPLLFGEKFQRGACGNSVRATTMWNLRSDIIVKAVKTVFIFTRCFPSAFWWDPSSTFTISSCMLCIPRAGWDLGTSAVQWHTENALIDLFAEHCFFTWGALPTGILSTTQHECVQCTSFSPSALWRCWGAGWLGLWCSVWCTGQSSRLSSHC